MSGKDLGRPSPGEIDDRTPEELVAVAIECLEDALDVLEDDDDDEMLIRALNEAAKHCFRARWAVTTGKKIAART